MAAANIFRAAQFRRRVFQTRFPTSCSSVAFSSASSSSSSAPSSPSSSAQWWIPHGWTKEDAVRDGDQYNRWLALGPAVAVEMSIGAVYCWSMWTGPLTRAVGVVAQAPIDWNLAAVQPAFSCCALTLGLTTAALGKWVDQVGPRAAGSVGALAWGSGLAVAGLGVELHSLPLIYLGYSGLGGIGWGLMYLTPVSAMMKWFPDRRGLATGITLSAFGLGATVGPMLIGAGLEHFFAAPELVAAALPGDLTGGLPLSTLPNGTQVIDVASAPSSAAIAEAHAHRHMEEVVVATAGDAARSGVGSGAGVYLAGTGDSGAAGAFASLGCLYGAAGLVGSRLLCVPNEGWEPRSRLSNVNASNVNAPRPDANHADQIVTDQIVSSASSPSLEASAENGNAVREERRTEGEKKNDDDSRAGANEQPRSGGVDWGVPAEVAVKTPQFPLLWMTVFGYATGGLALISSAKLLVSDIFGGTLPDLVTPGFATAYLGAIGLANSSGRFGWAAASDLIGRRATYALFGAAVPVMAGAPFLAHYAATTATAGASAASATSVAALPLYAFCGGSLLAITFYGGTFSVLPAYIADLWGQKHSAAIHGKALTAWSAASVTGPMGLAELRGFEERKAMTSLLENVDPAAFERSFGCLLTDSAAVSNLINAKTVTIARLMEIAPPGTQDPTPFLYDSTCFSAAALLGTAAISHYFLRAPDVTSLLEKEAQLSSVATQKKEKR